MNVFFVISMLSRSAQISACEAEPPAPPPVPSGVSVASQTPAAPRQTQVHEHVAPSPNPSGSVSQLLQDEMLKLVQVSIWLCT